MIVQAVRNLLRVNLKTALLVILVIYIFSIFVPYLRAPRSERSAPSLTWSPTPGAPGPDRAALIQDPQDALNVRLTLLREARETLDITYYSIRNDQAGQAFAAELLSAADRGVRIRLLLDGKLGLLNPENRRVLAVHENIELKRFSPLKLYAPWRWNDTLHDKFIVADGQYLLLGGRNLESSQYLAEEEGPFIKHDWDVLVASEPGQEIDSVIRDAEAYYEELWSMDRLETVPVRTERQRRNAEGEDRWALEDAAGEFREG